MLRTETRGYGEKLKAWERGLLLVIEVTCERERLVAKEMGYDKGHRLMSRERLEANAIGPR